MFKLNLGIILLIQQVIVLHYLEDHFEVSGRQFVYLDTFSQLNIFYQFVCKV